MADNEVKYQVDIVKGQDDMPAINAEMQQGGAAAEEAAGKTTSAYGSVKEAVHEIHSPLRLITVAMRSFGEIGVLVAGAVALAWEAMGHSTEEATKSVISEYSANLNLIQSLKDSEAAGVKLTQAQKDLLDATQKVAEINQRDAINGMKDMDEELKKKIESVKRVVDAENAQAEVSSKLYESNKLGVAGSAEGVKMLDELEARFKKNGGITDQYTDQLDKLNQQLKDNEANIAAMAKGYANNEAMMKAQNETAAAKKKAKDELDAQELKDAATHYKNLEELASQHEKADLAEVNLTADQKRAIITKWQADEIALITAAGKKAETSEQEIQDQIKKIKQTAATQNEAIAKGETTAMEKIMEQQSAAFVNAASKEIEAGKSVGDAMEAGTAAVIEAAASEASKMIEIKGAQAAAIAFASAPNPFIGAALALGTLAWYSALAITVGVAGAELGASMTPSTSSSPSGGSSGSGSTATTASTASTSPSVTSSNNQGVSGGGSGTITINVMLDSNTILQMISQASFNGNLVISANAVKG